MFCCIEFWVGIEREIGIEFWVVIEGEIEGGIRPRKLVK